MKKREVGVTLLPRGMLSCQSQSGCNPAILKKKTKQNKNKNKNRKNNNKTKQNKNKTKQKQKQKQKTTLRKNIFSIILNLSVYVTIRYFLLL